MSARTFEDILKDLTTTDGTPHFGNVSLIVEALKKRLEVKPEADDGFKPFSEILDDIEEADAYEDLDGLVDSKMPDVPVNTKHEQIIRRSSDDISKTDAESLRKIKDFLKTAKSKSLKFSLSSPAILNIVKADDTTGMSNHFGVEEFKFVDVWLNSKDEAILKFVPVEFTMEYSFVYMTLPMAMDCLTGFAKTLMVELPIVLAFINDMSRARLDSARSVEYQDVGYGSW